MENLLKTIERSENNNPLLTAALEEIEILTAKLTEIKSVAFGSNFCYSDDDEFSVNVVPDAEIDTHKIDIIQSLVTFR